MKIALDNLKSTTLKILEKSGYPPGEAKIILDVLMYAQLRGNNQGIVKLIGAGMPRNPNAQPVKTIRETKLSALLDGGQNTGMVVVTGALDLALQKAREHGIGIVGTNNTNTSTGAIGYYANHAARAGFIAFVFAGSGEYVAMHGSYQPILGTNPLAIGIPTSGDADPIVFDMATSAIARFGIVEARAAGRSIPPGLAYDADGQLTTDPAAALAGAIRAFDGHKGSGLAFMVEILAHPLVSTTPGADGKKSDWGNLIFVLDPELLTDRDSFAQRVTELAAKVKNTRKLPGVEEILLPGERGNRLLAEVLRTGEVEIDDALWSELSKIAASS